MSYTVDCPFHSPQSEEYKGRLLWPPTPKGAGCDWSTTVIASPVLWSDRQLAYGELAKHILEVHATIENCPAITRALTTGRTKP